MVFRGLAWLAGMTLSGCVSVAHTEHLIAEDWRYATDPHGSKVILSGPLVENGQVDIEFFRVPRVDKKNNSWVELIYGLPNGSLADVKAISLTYKSDKPLIIKLSQKDYGRLGDKSYAHYQIKLPQTGGVISKTVSLESFSRPGWTPMWSSDKGLIKENINALYFVPDLTDKDGGSANLNITELALL